MSEVATEKITPCDPPCSIACMVTGGVHHTSTSLYEAALEEIVAHISPA